MLLIGIDEAGYGPLLGPLCHGYCAIRCPIPDNGEPPDLWKLLHPSVMRFPGFDGSTTVDDSKKIHCAPGGRELLARGVRAFLECLEQASPPAGDLYTTILPSHDRAKLEEDAWCAAAPDRPPSNGNAAETGKRISKKVAAPGPPPANIPALRDALKHSGISVLAVGARGMSAKHYNVALESAGNKADVNWNVIAEQFSALVGLAQPGESVHAVIDRQGGRKFYAGRIAALFPGAMPWTESESPQASVYRVESSGRVARLAFMVGADGHSLPVALGSMAAKLTRELCMHRLNAFFRGHAPELKPTAGYYADANRFLHETRGLRMKLGIENAALIRAK